MRDGAQGPATEVGLGVEEELDAVGQGGPDAPPGIVVERRLEKDAPLGHQPLRYVHRQVPKPPAGQTRSPYQYPACLHPSLAGMGACAQILHQAQSPIQDRVIKVLGQDVPACQPEWRQAHEVSGARSQDLLGVTMRHVFKVR